MGTNSWLLAADTTSSSTALWFTLAGALGGVLFTGAFAIVNSILNNRWQERNAKLKGIEEREKQIRQDRREAYASFWSAYQAYERALAELAKAPDPLPHDSEIRIQVNTALSDLTLAQSVARLICSAEVEAAFFRHAEHSVRLQQTALARAPMPHAGSARESRDLINAMKAELV
jgi:hypothetical protein